MISAFIMIILLLSLSVHASPLPKFRVSAEAPAINIEDIITIEINYSWLVEIENVSEDSPNDTFRISARTTEGRLNLTISHFSGSRMSSNSIALPIGSEGDFQIPLQDINDLFIMYHRISVSAFPSVSGPGFPTSGKIDWKDEGSESFEIKTDRNRRSGEEVEVSLGFLLNIAVGFSGKIDGREFSVPPTELTSVEATPVVSFSVQDSQDGLFPLLAGGVAITVSIVFLFVLRRRKMLASRKSRKLTASSGLIDKKIIEQVCWSKMSRSLIAGFSWG